MQTLPINSKSCIMRIGSMSSGWGSYLKTLSTSIYVQYIGSPIGKGQDRLWGPRNSMR